MDVWQRAVDTERFSPAFRSEEWRRRITGGHPERVVLTYVGRLGAGMPSI
jgi:sulfoquinovosyltransferase